ncbi:aldehyde ferredoxin oxidoreductase family protein [Oceanirhabdus seepicola]|uniref:Aldehyde ferredoxin oxidoreductase family protein n=2 Tax=Oceanirhabdus seepicola TaxID=2828781 RepID=A0A9J6NUU8_9CLOT|nr:aldehyde ferredoxin oxidoreductase family protein [Oceanirhabdus seepicola]
MGKVLKIDLTNKTSEEYPFSDEEREMYLGGKIMAAKILYDLVPPEVEPLSDENVVVISTGPLTGTGAPSSSRFNISSVSPATNLIASSNCGGTFGLHTKKAGYDALIITGKSDEKVWLEIFNDDVKFNSADSLWGKKVIDTQEALPKDFGKVVIGPAGENLVNYAAIFSGERAAGRAGLGAVLGYKNLKGIAISGKNIVKSKNPEKVNEFNNKWIRNLQKHPLTGQQLPKYGTAGFASIMNKEHSLATKNFTYGQYEHYKDISGETLTEKYLVTNKGCVTCPIKCSRVVEYDGKRIKGPELETLGLLGPNWNNHDMQKIIEMNYELDELGMDTISLGGTIAFAMELNEKGLWDNGLEFGKIDGMIKVFEDIAYRRGIGDDLANGSKFLMEKYGGEEFAIQSKGMELSAYEPRSSVGLGLGYAVSNRGGCHLNAGYSILMENLAMNIDKYSTVNKAELTALLQNALESGSAAGSCLFTMFFMIPGHFVTHRNRGITKIANKAMTIKVTAKVVDMLNKNKEKKLNIHLPMLQHTKALELVTGMKMSFGKLSYIGERGYNIERLFNIRRGLKRADDSLPKRLTHVLQDESNPKSKVPLELLKDKYYKTRGWSVEGIPTTKTLKRLKIEGFREEVVQ